MDYEFHRKWISQRIKRYEEAREKEKAAQQAYSAKKRLKVADCVPLV